ncbi:exodeoxyribonuclease III [Corynebacterium atypicum]|uniref:Exodeoxyribonuclease III n=1 Tax=Corynebacterium atypicum TaxID=191610 RepID=A0ABM5QPJ4_9CORY|nr:exodeoxyribonuclease III [Corynebacterium atypicum]AIG64709.1 exodeoxyribonuclease III [Corynebacterium atypicum]
MRIATWNVNSARTRVDRMADFLSRHEVDVLAVQETKCTDKNFPADRFTDLGYEVAHVGYSQWNGVAILSRVGLVDVTDHFDGQPGFAKSNDPADEKVEARAVAATCGGVRVVSLYVPNGRGLTDPHYQYKVRWLWRLRDVVADKLAERPDALMALMGDFNIAPRDQDVWDRAFFEGKTHVTEPERAAFQGLEEAGLTEVTRQFTEEPRYTYWDYTAMRFQRNQGMRIDFQLASSQLARRARRGFIDVAERDGKGASDHAPVVVDYELGDFDAVR